MSLKGCLSGNVVQDFALQLFYFKKDNKGE
jgi:hypothetical protein